jgi:hypothetical protein
MLKYILSVLLLVGSLSAQWKDWSSYPEWDNWGKRQGSVLIPTEGLKLLVDPGRQIIANSPQNPQKPYAPLQYGSELVDNGDFHDFTIDVSKYAPYEYYIFDDYYHTQEGTGLTYLNSLSGSHTLTKEGGSAVFESGTSTIYEGGNVLTFDGIDDALVGTTSSSSDNVGTSDFSIVAKVRFNNTSGTQLIYGKYLDSIKRWNIHIEFDGKLTFYGYGGSLRCSATSYTVSPNTDYVIALTADRTTQKFQIYVNGDSVATTTNALSTTNFSDAVKTYTGKYGGGGSYLNGKIYHFAYWKRKLTVQEIKELSSLAKGWTWNGVGDISKSGFSQVVEAAR